MIKFENTEIYGWEAAVRGMRNPMNSWAKIDSFICDQNPYYCDSCKANDDACEKSKRGFNLGPNDHKLMMTLRNAGTDHRKFMRYIQVTVDITAPIYWWKEFDTYKVGTVANSTSTMHKIAAKEFVLDDFSHDHLIDYTKEYINDSPFTIINGETIGCGGLQHLMLTMNLLNYYRDKYLATNNKKYWWQLIQLLPSSYNQKRTVLLNYEVLANMAKKGSRRDHKLDEWRVGFMEWIRTLPYPELIFGEE